MGRSTPATLAFALLLAIAMALPASAWAGTYHVYTCRTPAGQAAPADGWSGSTVGSDVGTSDGCGSGGALVATVGGDVAQPANAAEATWGYTAPLGTAIQAAVLWRYAQGNSVGYGASSITYLAAPQNQYDASDVFDRCVNCGSIGTPSSPFDPSNRVAAPAANVQGASHMYAVAQCGGKNGQTCPTTGSGSSAPPDAQIEVFAADITLNDQTTPTVSGVGGTLTTATTLKGSQDVSFSAADSGPGLYQVVFLVDGKAVSAVPVNSNGGRCVDAGGTSDGTNAFLYGQPCVASATVDDAFDTAQVPDGSHELVVQVTDASGAAATALDRHVTFQNGPAPLGPLNGVDAASPALLTAHWANTKRPTLTSRWGRSRHIVGRLTTTGGQPIGAASIQLLSTPAYAGAKAVDLASAKTNAKGQFSVAVPTSAPSASLSLRYYAHLGDTATAASAGLRLLVPAAVTLRVSPHVTSVGRTITFTGVLHGNPIPAGGKQLLLEARQAGGAWIEFRDIRTGARGRFRASYRFRFPGPADYQFRALSPYEADFPFQAGGSNVVGVREH